MDYEKENARILSLYGTFLNFSDKAIKKEDVENLTKEIGVSEKQAFCFLLAAFLGVDAYGRDREFFNEYILPSVVEAKVEDYYKDEYFSILKKAEAKIGNFELKTLSYEPYQPFVIDDFLYFKNGKVLPQLGFFNCPYNYPALLEKGVEWMTLLPNEINSQKEAIQKAHGNVLTYGLGLGYYIFQVAVKKEVSSVTVVDISQEAIDIFKGLILTKFPNYAAKKVKLIKSDAFLFAEGLKAGDYDFIYADIWHDAGDGAPLYERFKKLEKFCPTAEYYYWIEKTIKYYLN